MSEVLPIKYIAVWGMFALMMFLGHAHLVNGGSSLSPFYVAMEGGSPTMTAALD